MTITKQFSSMLSRISASALLLSLSLVPVAWADVDWGGGLTRFLGQDGQDLTAQTGCAVLIAVSEGELIDFQTYIPESPADLVTVGATLSDGENVNRVLALSNAFYSGYLLYSAIPDIGVETLEGLGMVGGESLHLVVWDCTTFNGLFPSDSSFYASQPLYEEGTGNEPVYVSLVRESFYAQLAYPDGSLVEDVTALSAERAGHNEITGFTEWLESRGESMSSGLSEDLRDADTDGNGRSNLEEYVFRSRPRMDLASDSASSLLSASVSKSESTLAQREADSSVSDFIVELRANDSSLTYTAHASTDLRKWQSYNLYFEEGRWYTDSAQMTVNTTSYIGEGVWQVAMRYDDGTAGDSCFYKMSADLP